MTAVAAAQAPKNWNQIKGKPGDWPAILIGNGASMNVSSTFNYKTLYERACTLYGKDRLDDVDQALFEEIATVDFELVLAYLRHALVVGKLTGADKKYIKELEGKYTRIRRALGAAVRSVHPQYTTIGEDRLKQIGLELLNYKWVFSTNYDLIVYWSAMKAQITNFYDFLGGQPCRFRTANVDKAPEGRTKLLFPHGALHLYVETKGTYEGIVHKRVNAGITSILDQLLFLPEPPLVVAEGSAADKKAVIYSDRYLTFAYEQLGKVREPMVIFGSELGDKDEHIVQTLEPKGRRIAVSIHGAEKAAQKKMARLSLLLGDADELIFFAAETHPLGDPKLNVA
jgi:Domain of unknown function (DUF4917)